MRLVGHEPDALLDGSVPADARNLGRHHVTDWGPPGRFPIRMTLEHTGESVSMECTAMEFMRTTRDRIVPSAIHALLVTNLERAGAAAEGIQMSQTRSTNGFDRLHDAFLLAPDHDNPLQGNEYQQQRGYRDSRPPRVQIILKIVDAGIGREIGNAVQSAHQDQVIIGRGKVSPGWAVLPKDAYRVSRGDRDERRPTRHGLL
jgi:hypothetical protein